MSVFIRFLSFIPFFSSLFFVITSYLSTEDFAQIKIIRDNIIFRDMVSVPRARKA